MVLICNAKQEKEYKLEDEPLDTVGLPRNIQLICPYPFRRTYTLTLLVLSVFPLLSYSPQLELGRKSYSVCHHFPFVRRECWLCLCLLLS